MIPINNDTNNNSDVNITDQEENSQEIKKLVSIFIDNWKWFILSVMLCLFAALLYLELATPVYKINATLLVEDSQKGGGSSMFGQTSDVLSDFGDLFSVKSSVDNEAQVLQTKNLMRQVVKDMKLYITYFDQNSLRDFELYKNNPIQLSILSSIDSLVSCELLFDNLTDRELTVKEISNNNGSKFDSAYTVEWNKPFKTKSGIAILEKTGVPFEKEAKNFAIRIVPIKTATGNLQKILSVAIPNKQVSTINLQLDYALPPKGEDILNTIIRDYVQGNILQKNAFADSTIDFINSRLVVVDKELSDIEKGVETFKQANNIADIEMQSQAVVNNASEYLKQLNDAEVQEQIINSMLQYVEETKNNERPVPSLSATPDPTFLTLLEKYNSSLITRDRLAISTTEENPFLQNLDNQINNLRKDLITNLQNQLSAIRIAKQKLQAQNNSINTYIRSVPAKERSFLDLSRQQDIKQALFIFLLQKKEEIAVTKASNVASARLIDNPDAEITPFSPKKIIILLGAFVAGLLLPFGVIITKNILSNRINSLLDIKAMTSLSVIGEIGHNPEKVFLIYNEKSRSFIAEQFRALRANLQFIVGANECPVILFTSSMSGEGKSFISTNLALSMASLNKRVLLMELDLRKPKLAINLDINNTVGFSNYVISNRLALDDIIIKTKVDKNIDLIPSGLIPPNPAELLSDSKLKDMLHTLKSKYDIIIIDAPPIGVVADAQLIAPLANIVLYVAREGFTFKYQLNIANDLVRSNKISRMYLVVNDIKSKTSQKYGYGYGNGSGYGYSSEQTPGKRFWEKLKSN